LKTWRHGALFFSERDAGTRRLASALAAGDTAAMQDLEQRLAASTKDDDASRYDLLDDTFFHRHLLGAIDHRSRNDETISQVDPMLARFGIRNFDWSFGG